MKDKEKKVECIVVENVKTGKKKVYRKLLGGIFGIETSEDKCTIITEHKKVGG